MATVLLPSREPWIRHRHDAVLAGVCALLADRSGTPRVLVRLLLAAAVGIMVVSLLPTTFDPWMWEFTIDVFAVTSPVLLVYVGLWWALPMDDETAGAPAAHGLSAVRGRPSQAAAGAGASADRPRSMSMTPVGRFVRWMGLAAAAALASLVVIMFSFVLPTAISSMMPLGQTIYDSYWGSLLPVGVLICGSVVLGVVPLSDLDRDRRLGSTAAMPLGGMLALALAIMGLLLAALGLASNLFGFRAALVLTAAASVIAVLIGVVLVPWGQRLWHGIREETEARALAQHRSEMTAHLHDSVLQTLAMMQRPGMTPEDVRRLARRQERELRGWLYRDQVEDADDHTDLRAAVESLTAEIEDAYGVDVHAVVVGNEAVPCEQMHPLLGALREATLNACRHGGEGVDVFVDITEQQIEAFVRDRGPGFDLAEVPRDRLGVRESVIGRMRRAGGAASVRPAPGGGTEVALELPRIPQ